MCAVLRRVACCVARCDNWAGMDESPVRVGEVLAGKYRVERVLGAGGMGVVIAARHLHLDDTVAIHARTCRMGLKAARGLAGRAP